MTITATKKPQKQKLHVPYLVEDRDGHIGLIVDTMPEDTEYNLIIVYKPSCHSVGGGKYYLLGKYMNEPMECWHEYFGSVTIESLQR